MEKTENVMGTREDFEAQLKREYTAYQLDWMTSHGYGIKDLIRGLQQYIKDDPDAGENPDLCNIFDRWETDCGFDGAIWSCFDEWLDCDRRQRYFELPTPDFSTWKIQFDE